MCTSVIHHLYVANGCLLKSRSVKCEQFFFFKYSPPPFFLSHTSMNPSSD